MQNSVKNRNILYGYGYFDGKIDIHPQESEIVKEVYNDSYFMKESQKERTPKRCSFFLFVLAN